MLSRLLNTPFKSRSGFSLVELLLALLLGSLLLAMVISLYITSMSTGSQSLKYSRLRSDLQSLVAILETDIRRAGYSAGQEGYLVGVNGLQSVDINSTHDCIVYYYNHNNSLTIEHSNKMAFAFKDNTLKFKTGVNQIANETCASTTGWISVSDAGFVKITALSFLEETNSINGVTLRSVKISLSGELASDANYSQTVTSHVQVRNIELL